LEKGRDARTLSNDEVPSSLPTPNSLAPAAAAAAAAVATPAAAASSFLRLPLEPRAFTTTGPINHGSLESPAVVAGDQDDPLARVSDTSPLQITILTNPQLLMRAHSS